MAESVIINVAARWAAFLRRVMALPKDRRYAITLTVRAGYVDWTISDVGKVESVD